MSNQEKVILEKSATDRLGDAESVEMESDAEMPYLHSFDEDRVDRVASSHGDGEHYALLD